MSARGLPDLRRRLGSTVARGALAMTFWQSVRVGAQALWMVAIARALGATGYGTFAGAAGLASAIGSLTGMGFGLLLLQDVTRTPHVFPESWRRANAAFLITGALLWILYTTVAPWVFHNTAPAWQYAAIGLPEIILFPQAILASYAFQTHERMSVAGAIYALVPAGNLLAAAGFLIFSSEYTLGKYLPWHVASSVIAAVAGRSCVTKILRPGRASLSLTRRDLQESLGFSLMRVIDTALVSVDKTLVLRLAGAEIAGWYTAAFRLASVLAIPVSALAMAALPRLFRESGGTGSRRVIGILFTTSLIGGTLGAAAMLAGSWLLPWILGPGFAGAAHAARALCMTPLLIGLCATGANILVTSDRRRARTLAQGTGLVALFTLAMIFIPRYGIAGAAVMLQGALGFTASLLWMMVYRQNRPIIESSRRCP